MNSVEETLLRRHLKKFIFALVISASGFALNEVVYRFTAIEDGGKKDDKPIASVLRLQSENHRKSEDSELWNEISNGDSLYAGDTLRTSSEGTLQIQFTNSDKVVDIEPDSLLVLRMNDGKINLSLLDGNLFVKNDKGAKGETATGAEPEIVIAGKDGQVLEQASTSPERAAQAQDPLVMKFPTADDSLFINPDHPEPVTFRWENRRQDVRFEVRAGAKRKDMSVVANAAPGVDSAKISLKPGFFYWQIVAKDSTGKEIFQTPITRHEVHTRFAPSPVFPSDKGLVRLKQTGDPVEVKWFKPAEYSAVTVEIFSDAELKKAVFAETFDKKDSHQLGTLAPGTYHWRLKGTLKDGGDAVTSAVATFVVNTKANMKIPVEWDGDTETIQSYIDQPVLNLSWKTGSTIARSYRVKIAPEGENVEQASPQVISDPHWSAKVSKPGRYIAMIEALDDEAEKVGSVGPRRFEVRPQPLLPRIRLTSHTDDVAQADDEGSIKLAWGAVEGAVGYRLTLVTKDGKPVQQEDVQGAVREIKDLLPGVYKLSISAVDDHGRLGEKGEPLVIVVPESAALESPKIRKVEVE